MKITKVEPLLLDRFLYVRIGTWGQLEASAASIAKYGEYLVGRDPFPIEHHWNVMLRANHFTGGAITGAVSAIDIALWDIKGKAFNVPVYELLGGRMRHKARLYGHVKGRTIEKLVEEAVRLKHAGTSTRCSMRARTHRITSRTPRRSRRRSTTCAGCARRSAPRWTCASRSIAA